MKSTTQSQPIQLRDGLPDALIEEKRFFPLPTKSKSILPNDWNNPENWCCLDDVSEDKCFGFAIGNDTNYLFIDADHVLNPETGQIVPWVYDVYKRLTKVSNTYVETSMSGTGFHMICDLGDFAENYARESNGYNQIIVEMDPEDYDKLSKEEKDATPKIEFFYHANGRYAYLTGKHKKKYEVAKNEDAAAIFSELLEIRKEFHAKYANRSYESDRSGVIEIDDATRARVLDALPFVSANSRDTWVKIGIALHNCGFPFEIWDEWSKFTDQRTGEICDKYKPDETPKIWKSFQNTKSLWNAGTIIRMAKENGWNAETTKEPTPEPKLSPVKSLTDIFGNDAFVDVRADYHELIPEKQWTVENLCTSGESAIISGASKSGKSYLVTSLSICVASGSTWLGRFPCQRKRVLYLNGENQKDDARRRFQIVFDSMGIAPDSCEEIHMICADGFMIAIQDLKDTLIEAVRKNDYGIIILDPLYCFYKGSEIDEQDAKEYVGAIKEVCRETGVVIFCVHHHSKGAAFYKNASSRASGSGMLQRAFSTLLDLSEVDSENLPDGVHGFEFSGQPRQAASFKMNLLFDYPLWTADNKHLLPENALNKKRTAAARSRNANNRKSEEVRKNLPNVLNQVFSEMAKTDDSGDYITVGDVVSEFRSMGIETSETAISRKVDDGVLGFKRDPSPGKRRYIRKTDFEPVSKVIIPKKFFSDLPDLPEIP